MARLIYGTGLRLQECLKLRIKDIDFETNVITVKSGIRTIQDLLGHARVNTTMIYTHVAKKDRLGVKSPLDSIKG